MWEKFESNLPLCHAHRKFLMFLAGNPNFEHLWPWFSVQIGFLERLTTGENLVLISQSTFEKFKINRFVFSMCLQLGKKILTFYLVGGKLKRQNCWFRISQKWIEISTTNFHQLLTFLKTRFAFENQGHRCSKFGFPAKNLKNLAGPIFELHPSNLLRNYIFDSCKNAEFLVRKSQVVLNLAESV